MAIPLKNGIGITDQPTKMRHVAKLKTIEVQLKPLRYAPNFNSTLDNFLDKGAGGN